MYRRDMHADLLEHAAVHHACHAAAAIAAGVVGVFPGTADEAAGRPIAQRGVCRKVGLESLEGTCDAVAQFGEPRCGARLLLRHIAWRDHRVSIAASLRYHPPAI